MIETAKTYGADAVAHGCNCFHTMKSGVAKRINDYTRGAAIEADKRTSYGDINKMGTYSRFTYEGIEYFNLYTQYAYMSQIKLSSMDPWPNSRPVLVHWMAFYESMREMIDNMEGNTVVIPEIGCGLANGKYEHFVRILNIIIKEYEKNNKLEIVVVRYDG